MKDLVVQKFGGTSVGNIERIQKVALLVKETSKIQQNVVVVSAMAGQTNLLVKLGHDLSEAPLPEAYDMLLASGEQVSCALLAIALNALGIKAKPLLGFQVGIFTDGLYSKAQIQKINTRILEDCIRENCVPVVAGFQGIHRSGDFDTITTLGRGGSDTSGVALAVALKAKRCDIYTDVEGVYTADPRIVPEARKIETISFLEMMELSSLGAKVMHMRSLQIAAKYNLPIRVLSSFNPQAKGTLIMQNDDLLEAPVVSAITSDSAECLFEVELDNNEAQFPAPIFQPLAKHGIIVDVIVKTPPNEKGRCSICFSLPKEDGPKAKELLSGYPIKVQLDSAIKISIVGVGMRTHTGVAAKMFDCLKEQEIPTHLITTSEIKISAIIQEKDKEKAIRALHEAFALADNKT
jgi:aspartate kinase